MPSSAPGKGPSLSARLVVGADGRHSLCREAAGIDVKRRALDQSALTFNVAPFAAASTISRPSFIPPHGPCVFVPLPGDRSSVVWVMTPNEAERLMALSDDDLSEAAERQSHSILGRMRVEPGRHLFPLAIEQPRQFARQAHRAGRRSRACAAADRRPGPEHGTARCRRSCRHRAGGDACRGEDPGCGSPQVLSRFESGATRRCRQPDVRDRHGEPVAAERFPADAVSCVRWACI